MTLDPKRIAEWKALAETPVRCTCARRDVSPVGNPPHPVTPDGWVHTFAGCGPVGANPLPAPASGEPRLAAAVPALIADNEALRSLLREVEWSSVVGPVDYACLKCGGCRPDAYDEWIARHPEWSSKLHRDHKQGCALAALLGGKP